MPAKGIIWKKHDGLQERILNVNLCAFYVAYTAHSLMLVINDAAKFSLKTENISIQIV